MVEIVDLELRAVIDCFKIYTLDHKKKFWDYLHYVQSFIWASTTKTKQIIVVIIITQAHKKKVKWTLHVSILHLWILSRWIRTRSQNFPWTPQFPPSLGEMREILEISVSLKAILIYAILNKTIIFSRISSRLVRVSL